MKSECIIRKFDSSKPLICDRKGCFEKSSVIIADFIEGAETINGPHLFSLCRKHGEEYNKHREEFFSKGERLGSMASDILSMLKELNKLMENSEKLRKSPLLKKESKGKPPSKLPEDEKLGGR